MDLTIIRDTREKQGWDLTDHEKPSGRCMIASMVIDTLPCGDYAIEGKDDLIAIERKASITELMGNLSSKANRDRFYREMEKLKDQYKYRYIVVESSINSDILSLGVPQSYNFPCSRMVKYLLEISMIYGVHTLFAGDRTSAIKLAKYLFDEAVRNA